MDSIASVNFVDAQSDIFYHWCLHMLMKYEAQSSDERIFCKKEVNNETVSHRLSGIPVGLKILRNHRK